MLVLHILFYVVIDVAENCNRKADYPFLVQPSNQPAPFAGYPPQPATQPLQIQNATTQPCCFICRSPDHFARSCPSRNQSNGNNDRQLYNRGLNVSRNEDVYIHMMIGSLRVIALLDSGCDQTIVPLRFVQNNPSLNIVPTTKVVRAANGTKLDITGELELPLIVGKQSVPIYALVSHDIEDFTIGMDFLSKYNSHTLSAINSTMESQTIPKQQQKYAF